MGTGGALTIFFTEKSLDKKRRIIKDKNALPSNTEDGYWQMHIFYIIFFLLIT